VKQAGFLVLYKTTMPGALIELGFVSNPTEEDFLLSESGQNQLASSIFKAFREYKASYEGGAVSNDTTEVVKDTYHSAKDTATKKPVKEISSKQNKTDKKEVSFRIQIVISKSKLSVSSSKFNGLSDIRFYQQNGLYKYTTGNFKTLNEAVANQKVVQGKGFKDCFVVCFLNDERITQDEAMKLSKQ
jgi:N-acetylmuramoyl-L-alanine amidase